MAAALQVLLQELQRRGGDVADLAAEAGRLGCIWAGSYRSALLLCAAARAVLAGLSRSERLQRLQAVKGVWTAGAAQGVCVCLRGSHRYLHSDDL